MRKKIVLIGAGVAVSLAVLALGAATQDKYTVKVPNGLAFSEFKGYETWQTISVSHNGPRLAVILGNPSMIAAYKAGTPGNGKPFPDGARMAKIHWNAKKNEAQPGQPGQPFQPGEQTDVDFMLKDSKRFADSGGWGYGVFEYETPHPALSRPAPRPTLLHRATTRSAASRATRS